MERVQCKNLRCTHFIIIAWPNGCSVPLFNVQAKKLGFLCPLGKFVLMSYVEETVATR